MLFEDLVAWQEARVLVKMIYIMTREKTISTDFRLVAQLRSAAVSIMSNVAEGFERHHLKEKIQFYNIARASCGEVRSLMYVVTDSFPILDQDVNPCTEKLNSIGKLITGLIQSCQKRAKVGVPRPREGLGAGSP